MKKIALVAAILSMVACSNHQSTSQTDADAGAPVCTEASCPLHHQVKDDRVNDTIQEDNWKFVLPGSGWTPVSSPDDTVRVVFFNKDLNMMTFFVKEATQQTFPEYIINTLRTFADVGMTISSTKQITINGLTFVVVAAADHDRTVWTWVNVSKKNGYIFSCAVADIENSDGNFNSCQQIANTIQIQ
jgi:hypothetical protein